MRERKKAPLFCRENDQNHIKQSRFEFGLPSWRAKDGSEVGTSSPDGHAASPSPRVPEHLSSHINNPSAGEPTSGSLTTPPPVSQGGPTATPLRVPELSQTSPWGELTTEPRMPRERRSTRHVFLFDDKRAAGQASRAEMGCRPAPSRAGRAGPKKPPQAPVDRPLNTCVTGGRPSHSGPVAGPQDSPRYTAGSGLALVAARDGRRTHLSFPA